MLCRYTDIIIRIFRAMFTVLIDQIEHLNNSSIQSYCVGLVYETNEIIQFNEQKLIDKNRCKCFFDTIAPANSMIRQYDVVDLVIYFYSIFLGYKVTLFSNSFICLLI